MVKMTSSIKHALKLYIVKGNINFLHSPKHFNTGDE